MPVGGYSWSDIFRIYRLAFSPDPISDRNDDRRVAGAGVSQIDAVGMLDIRGDTAGGDKGLIRLGSSSANELVDMTSVSDRQSRYKEYERLRNVPEIENCMTVFADEACVSGDTKVATPFGFPTMKWLAANKAGDRFLVYSWDADQQDYTLGWAFNPRKTGTRKTVVVELDEGSFCCTPDHLVLRRDNTWAPAGSLRFGDELMPFYKVQPNDSINKLRTGQFPRIFTFNDGWTHERFFVDKWRFGKTNEEHEKVHKAIRLVSAGLTVRQVAKYLKHQWITVDRCLRRNGFVVPEIQWLSRRNPDRRRVIDVRPGEEVDVYDISVEDHKCFATDSVILHNCQKDDKGNVCAVGVEDHEVKEEAEWFLFKLIDVNRKLWNWFKNDIIAGDGFYELVMNPEDPSDGILKVERLPQQYMYRIETVKGRLVEFQQAKDGPDYEALARSDLTHATDSEIQLSKAIRFAPEQIVHVRFGEDRNTFHPYGQSLIEPARGPAHQLRLMEDSMLVYRLSRAPERRVFYIDVGTTAGPRAEAFIERMKDQFKKRKTTTRGHGLGNSSVEERWHAPSQDEDYWIPLRPNSNTRVETLPGASNLGEVDDALYFRNKLFVSLNFPKNYFNQEDVNQTRITLSTQDVRFARSIERLQSSWEWGIREMVTRHLYLRGYPEESYEDLTIKMTPPSDWRELSRAEVKSNRINEATTMKSSQLYSDFDIYTRVFLLTEDDAKEVQARMKVQKMDDLKIQIIANNPAMLGVGLPGDGEQEIGAEPGLPAPEPGDQPPQGPPSAPALPPQGMRKYMSAGGDDEGEEQGQKQGGGSPPPLPDATEEEIRKYDLGIEDYASEQDHEDIDFSQLN